MSTFQITTELILLADRNLIQLIWRKHMAVALNDCQIKFFERYDCDERNIVLKSLSDEHESIHLAI